MVLLYDRYFIVIIGILLLLRSVHFVVSVLIADTNNYVYSLEIVVISYPDPGGSEGNLLCRLVYSVYTQSVQLILLVSFTFHKI